MPIRGIEVNGISQWFTKLNCKLLKEEVLAVDGYWFLRKYVNMDRIDNVYPIENTERFVAPVIKLVSMAKLNNFEILWIWDGLDYKKPIKEGTKFDEKVLLEKGYECHKCGDYDQSSKFLKQLFNFDDYVSDINKILRDFNHTSIRAPYSATAQIAYYLTSKAVTYAFCKMDTALYNDITKILVDINLITSDVFIFCKTSFLKFNMLNDEEFKSLSFLLGCEVCPTIPEYATNFEYQRILDIVKNKKLELFLNDYNKKKENKDWVEKFYAAFILVEFHPVMKIAEGRVLPMNSRDKLPGDFEAYFGKKLPHEIFKALFECKIAIDCVNNYIKENDSNELTKLSKEIVRCIADKKTPEQNIDEFIAGKVVFVTNLSKVYQILFYFLVENKLFENMCSEKINCLAELENKNTNYAVECLVDPEILYFAYRCNKLLKCLRNVNDLHKYVSKSEANSNSLDFDFTLLLNSHLHYKNEENRKNDIYKTYFENVKCLLQKNAKQDNNYSTVLHKLTTQ